MVASLIRDGDYLLDEETGCWIWQRSVGHDGYGRCARRGRWYLAHRLFWQELRGPIPDGMVMDHLCGVRSCVNPDHLDIVTRTENSRRSDTTKLTQDQVMEIRQLLGVIGYRRIAARYGVSVGAIRHIAKGATWTDVI